MSTHHGSAHPGRVPCGVAALALAFALCAARADAYTFSLLGDGTSQHLFWYTEGCVTNCWSFGSGCGSVPAANGRIPLNLSPPSSSRAGGMLDWTTSSGSLTVVTLTSARAVAQFNGGCGGAWASVDARATPLLFGIVPEAGDPIPLLVDVLVRPRLLGTVTQTTAPGGSAYMLMQMVMSVAVDGEIVCQDSLIREQTLVDGQYQMQPLAFGGVSSVVLHDITPATDIAISVWAYLRGYCTSAGGTNGVEGSSAYGDGPAIEILVSDANALDVGDEPPAHRLALAIGPNPSSAPRIRYTLPRATGAQVSLYDLRGRRVSTLVDGLEPAGEHEAAWNGRTTAGDPVPPGVYFVELRAGAERLVRKLVVGGR